MNDMSANKNTKIVRKPAADTFGAKNPIDAALLGRLEHDVRRDAFMSGGWGYRVDRATAYSYESKYEASGQVALAVCNPNGLVVIWIGAANLEGVAGRGCAEACVPGSGDLFDRRVKNKDRKDAAMALLKETHGRQFTALEQLASAAE